MVGASPAKSPGGSTMGYSKLSTQGLEEEEEEASESPYGFRGNPEARASCCGRLFVHWLWPLLMLGQRRKLEQSDMYPLLESERSEGISQKFEHEWAKAEGASGAPWRRMLIVLWALEGSAFTAMFLIKLLGDVFRFVTPAALQQVIGWLGDHNAPAPFWASFVPPDWRGIYYVFVMTGATVAQCFCYSNSNLRSNRVGVHIRSAITVAVYRKSLSQALCARGETTTGKLVNLIASDASRVMWSIPWLHFLPTGVFQLIGAMIFLYTLLGPAIFAGLAVTLVSAPLMSYLVKKNNEYNRVVLMRRDTRVSRVSELVNAIKLVKSNAWEEGFIKRITDARTEELAGLFRYYLYMLMSGVMWEGGVPMTAAATFIAYAYLGNTITPTIAFTALSLFDVMVEPCQDMAWIFSQFVVALTSFNRVGAFLESQELDKEAVRRSPVDVLRKSSAISIRAGYFGWGSAPQPDPELKQIKAAVKALDKAFEAGAITEKRHENSKAFLLDGIVPGTGETTEFSLQDINLTVETGSCLGIVGQVGSGKSALLHAMLGEMEVVGGTVDVRGHFAYVAQTAFIVNATIKENILFGQALDTVLYEQCLDICCLVPDLEILPGGDSCEIGEQGINLSGGQKQRLSLARAVYASLMGAADIILLDDVLSAVDAHVGARIMEECINKVLRKSGKTVILVTHAIQYLPQCDSVIVMDSGQIAETGTYDELMSLDGKLTALVETYETETGTPRAQAKKDGDGEDGDGDGDEEKDTQKSRKDDDGELVEEEKRDEGRVKLRVYVAYIRAAGFGMFMLVISLFMVFPATGMATSYWLVYWSEDKLGWTQYEYVAVYALIALGSILSIVCRQIFRTMLAVKAAKTMHEDLLVSVARAPLSFFHTTPAGRIINRFSSDQSTVDENFFNSFCGVFRNFFKLLITLFVIVAANPMFALFIVPISYIYVKINSFYISSNREVKRLESVSRSPVYSHFSETLQGAVTVRAYKRSDSFFEEHMKRLDENTAALFCSTALSAWLRLYCQGIIGGGIMFITALLGVMGESDPAVTGMAMQYAFQVIWGLAFFVMNVTNVEAQAVSLERIHQYSILPQEEPELKPLPAPTWPQTGEIEWQRMGLRYRKGLPPALRNVTCLIKDGEKVGVCGRTGAGKSSMTVGLLRLADEIFGSIRIDHVDHASIRMSALRSKLALIPQEATMFAGDIRLNLDPLQASTDAELWSVLRQVELEEVVKDAGGLTATVAEDGNNWSQGQRQLLCIARALLKRSRVVMLDEATASCDVTTDAMVQKVIRQVFKGCTVLTIAHRLHTIADSDKIMVLDQGEVAEFDSPAVLLNTPTSIYRSLVEESEKTH